jgi:hypothetical protein
MWAAPVLRQRERDTLSAPRSPCESVTVGGRVQATLTTAPTPVTNQSRIGAKWVSCGPCSTLRMSAWKAVALPAGDHVHSLGNRRTNRPLPTRFGGTGANSRRRRSLFKHCSGTGWPARAAALGHDATANTGDETSFRGSRADGIADATISHKLTSSVGPPSRRRTPADLGCVRRYENACSFTAKGTTNATNV